MKWQPKQPYDPLADQQLNLHVPSFEEEEEEEEDVPDESLSNNNDRWQVVVSSGKKTSSNQEDESDDPQQLRNDPSTEDQHSVGGSRGSSSSSSSSSGSSTREEVNDEDDLHLTERQLQGAIIAGGLVGLAVGGIVLAALGAGGAAWAIANAEKEKYVKGTAFAKAAGELVAGVGDRIVQESQGVMRRWDRAASRREVRRRTRGGSMGRTNFPL
jgi:hypothetical protein